jgi:hypothetical protein
MPRCGKKCFDKIKAMMVVAFAQSSWQKNPNRNESRYYYCRVCNSYHVTSKKENKVIPNEHI